MNAKVSMVAAVLGLATWSGTAPAELPGAAQKPAAPVLPAVSPEQIGVRLKALADQETKSLKGQEAGKQTARTQALRSQFQARRAVAISKAAADAAACKTTPKIYEVTPDLAMPDDPVAITGCGFGESKGMVILSDGNQQLTVTSWKDNAIEASLPHITGFADPKTVTLKVVTVEATKTAPSKAITLKPLLDLAELSPTGWVLEGCHKNFGYGIVHHTGALVSASCTDVAGTDRIRFNVALRNGWSFHSVIFTKLCGPTSGPCGGENDATPHTDVYQVGRPALPELVVDWKRTVSYYPAIRIMGPAGTPFN